METTLKLIREAKNELARRTFIDFVKTMQHGYDCQWFHKLIAEKCQALLDGEYKKLMLFVCPQHGKSTLASKLFPAWVLGNNPDMKIVGCSYSSDLAQSFSRDIQRTIDTNTYRDIFPDTYLNNSLVRSDSRQGYIRNVDMFEVVNKTGFYKAVGVCGGLTGTAVDLAIIDDPVKDAIEANSQVYRERVWDWYTNVLMTRLHNNSKVVLIMTRWHNDDLAGRILSLEPDKWKILVIPAIREDMDLKEDPREIGAALWPKRHNLEKLLNLKELSPRTFSSLYQQRPIIDSGNIIKREWFQTIEKDQFVKLKKRPRIDFYLDTAYTEKTSNDPSGIIAACEIDDKLYILNAKKVYMQFPELVRFVPEWIRENNGGRASAIRIEPKASGLSLIQQLRKETGLNVISLRSPKESKGTRLNVFSPMVEAGKVVLVKGSWNDEFMNEVCGFPAAKHDEYVDLLCYALNQCQDNDSDYYITLANPANSVSKKHSDYH